MKEERQREPWAEQMVSSPFASAHFTIEMMNRVQEKAMTATTGTKWRSKWVVALVSLVILCVVIGLSGVMERFAPNHRSLTGTSGEVKERLAYEVDGVLKLAVYPDPELVAGKPFGYIFHMTAPFAELKGRMLAIRAEHIESGQRMTAVAPEEIQKPSSGYQGLERYTAFINLPISGMWRYVVELDGEAYGDVVLQVPEPSWEISPMFKSGAYMLRGSEGKVGLIDAGFLAGMQQKYVWHFWEDGMKLEGAFTVKAVKQGERHIVEVFTADRLGGPLNGADRSVVSMMSLPEPGVWRLLPYIGDQQLDSIVVEAK
ncbi:DUF4871 domain-containing protein [Paenibacillus mendelii]|uniref:DUF4871 domain-containing protein n=1 Tax=Paenibacillus mendelii TaxID=206163 RepID=A0ABV6JGI5_9BACL|nr:DUF4871 domain-containing protein [Paenibacillus mendelii]MCQ6557691.1 DUF4871 domain-containing protein [Paenibacillus mendelii]